MTYCFNPPCPHPQNPEGGKFCIYCGSPLLLGDRYRALKSMSAEGIGRTFLGVDEGQTGRPRCIIKQVPLKERSSQNTEQATQTFLKEAIALQTLGQHPQIPQLLAYFEPRHSPGSMATLVQEWIDGTPVAEDDPYDEVGIYQLLHHILPVLQVVRDRGVIHRDINPNNILRPRVPRADAPLILVDFSTAKVTTKTALAKTGTAIGSAAYAAPEQLRGKATYASDLYSLGMTCIYLLTQMHPFDIYSSMDGIWVWPDFLTTPMSDGMKGIINKMLAEAVRDRYQSAAEVYRDLHSGGVLAPSILQPSTQPSSSLFPRWQCCQTLKGHLSSVDAIAFHPVEQRLVSGSADRTLKIWDLKSDRPQETLSGHRSIVTALSFTPDGELLVSGSWDYTLRIWQGDVEIHTLQDHSGWVQALTISPDGKLLVSGSADRTLKIWDLARTQLQATLSGHQGTICSVAISPDSKLLASGSSDRTLKIWDLATGTALKTLTGHRDEVKALVFSPSGQLLISGSSDRTIKIWDYQRDRILREMAQHEDAVLALAINQEGNLLVSGSSDKTIKLWHPGSGKLLHTLSGHEAGVLAVAFSPRDRNTILPFAARTIASGSQDKTIKLWRYE